MTYDIGSFEREEGEIRKAFAAKDAEISNLKCALEQAEEALREVKLWGVLSSWASEKVDNSIAAIDALGKGPS